MKRILITGASGLVGGAIARAIAHINQVYGFYCANELEPLINVIPRKVDLTNPLSVGIILGIEPQIIIHCAAQIPRGDEKSDGESAVANSLMDDHVFRAVRILGSELIYFSTTMVYGFPGRMNVTTEDFIAEKVSNYAAQKIRSESALQKDLGRGLILRINAPYGPMMTQDSVLRRFVRNAVSELPLTYYGTGSRSQDFTHVDDIAYFIDYLISKGKLPSGCYNLSHGKPISMKQLAELIVQLLGSRSNVFGSNEPDPQEFYAARFDIRRAISELGWAPKISLEQGILQMAEHFQEG